MPTMTAMPPLDRRIALALTEPTSSVDVEKLITETEAAIAAALAEADTVRERALDPRRTDDTHELHVQLQEINFQKERLQAALPQLKHRLTEVQADEARRSWELRKEAVKVKRDSAVAEFNKVPVHISELLRLFSLARQVDAEIGAVNAEAPPGAEHLIGVEATSRGIAGFDSYQKSMMLTTVICDLNGKQIRPPRSTISVTQVMPPAQSDLSTTDDWWKANEARAQERRRQAQQQDEFYSRQTEEQERRYNEEERRRFGR